MLRVNACGAKFDRSARIRVSGAITTRWLKRQGPTCSGENSEFWLMAPRVFLD
jgi:hypothetical protein